jgi:hypothetical protein
MLLVTSISPSLSFKLLDLNCLVVEQAFWGGNTRHG